MSERRHDQVVRKLIGRARSGKCPTVPDHHLQNIPNSLSVPEWRRQRSADFG